MNSQPLPAGVLARLLARVEVLPDGCWRMRPAQRNSKGGYNSKGYPQVTVLRDGRRVSMSVGPVLLWARDGRPLTRREMACHRCDHRWCVNPAHIYRGTGRTNHDDMRRAGTYCAWGRRMAPHA